ncbi:reverse transcriptase domain-containing protein [Tanacetum coccineum]
MRTRSQTRNRNRQQQAQPAVVQPFHLEEPFVNPSLVPMADNRTMAQLLQAPTEGYEDAIVIPEINANFELKHGLINLVQNKQFFGHDKEDPHAHIRYFNKITSTMRFPDIPSTSIKLMLFSFSLEGSARIWLEKEPPRSILTWDDLVSKFINQFFPPSKTTNLHNEITRFQQRFDESFYEAWDRFNDLLRACPYLRFHNYIKLDTFYNALNANVKIHEFCCGWKLFDKMPRESLSIIESKSKFRNHETMADSANRWKWFIRDNIQRDTSQAAAANFNQGNTNARPPMVSNQIRPPGMERESDENNYKEQTNFQGSTAQIPPPVIPISIPEPDIPKNLPKQNIPMEKIFQIFQDLRFDISFADALLLMPRFASSE